MTNRAARAFCRIRLKRSAWHSWHWGIYPLRVHWDDRGWRQRYVDKCSCRAKDQYLFARECRRRRLQYVFQAYTLRTGRTHFWFGKLTREYGKGRWRKLRHWQARLAGGWQAQRQLSFRDLILLGRGHPCPGRPGEYILVELLIGWCWDRKEILPVELQTFRWVFKTKITNCAQKFRLQ